MKNKLLIICFILLSSVVSNSVMASSIYLDLPLAQVIKGKKVTIKATNKTLSEILIMINKQTNIDYGFQGTEIDKTKKFSLEVTNVTVEQALNTLFNDSPYSYKISGTRIIIVLRNIPATSNKRITIKGKVVNVTDKEPLPGTMVIIDGTQNGAIADANGNFSLQTNILKGTLTASCIGFATQKIAYTENSDLMIKMQVEALQVDDVVVIGYGTRSKKELISSVSTVTSE